MASDDLNQAVQLIKAGNKQAALPLLKQIIQSDPNNETAWLWLYTCVENPAQKKYCLQKALEINPNNINAREALNKITASVSPASQMPTPRIKNQQYQAERPQAVRQAHRSIQKQKSKTNRNLLLISGGILVCLFCISGFVLGGIWAYNNYFIKQQFADTQNTPLDFGGNSNGPESSKSDESIVATPLLNNTTSAITPTSESNSNNSAPPDIRFVPYSFLRDNDGMPAGWDKISVALAIENYSDSIVSREKSTITVTTSQGNKYDCTSLNGGAPYGNEKDFVPVNFRVLYYVDCQIPTPSSGFTLDIKYTIVKYSDSTFLDNTNCNTHPEYCTQWDDVNVSLNPEQTNPNMTFPLIESANADIETYAKTHNIKLVYLDQPFDLFDTTLLFKKKTPEPFDHNPYFLFDTTTKYLASDTTIFMEGTFYNPDGLAVDCSFSQYLGPGQSSNNLGYCDISRNYDITAQSEYPTGACLFIRTSGVKSEAYQLNRSFLLMCLR